MEPRGDQMLPNSKICYGVHVTLDICRYKCLWRDVVSNLLTEPVFYQFGGNRLWLMLGMPL
jgi:hypothetical protein